MRHFRRLLRYVGPHRRDLLLVVITMVVGAGLDALKPWPTKILVDDVLGGAAPPGGLTRLTLLAVVAVSTVVIFVVSTLAATAGTVRSVRLGQRMVYDLGADLFLHLQRLSLCYHARRPLGDTIARVTGDPYCVQMLVTGVLLPLLQSLVMLAAMLGVMWRLDVTMTLLAVAVVPFLMLAIHAFGRPMREYTRRRIDLEARMMSSVEQTLGAVPAVQAFTREEIEHARFRRQAGQTVAAYERATRADMAFKLCVGLVTATGTAAIMWVGGRYALEGQVTTGTILVFLSYLASLYGPLNTITYTVSTVQQAAANADRAMEVLDTPPDPPESPDAREIRVRGHVRYENVGFGYEPVRPVLRGVTFEAAPGDTLAIVGATGAGKTTLVNLLLRFFDVGTGRITVDGHDLRELRLRSLREQVAIVLQDPFIFPLTVAENIAYGRPHADRAAIEAAAVAANADEFIARLPQGYDTVVGERGATLSGGEKQRLSIARAFLKDAPILILDEPTSALDATTEAAVLEALRRLSRGRTTLIIAHRLSTARDADRILVLEAGEIVEQGDHAGLLARNGRYAELCRRQFLSRQAVAPATATPPR